jgi:NADH:ubiquinone oxidoreductase subunit F (NADH-binding)
MVEVAKFFIKFSVDESCGKCTPCRIGNKKLLNMLESVTAGEKHPDPEAFLQELETLSKTIMATSLCGLGQSSPNPVLSTIRSFRDEYLAYLNGTKKTRSKFFINDKCISCGRCAPVCPVNAIHKEGQQ